MADNKMRSFKYFKEKDNSITERNVYVVHENASLLSGFDFNYLSPEEQENVKKVFDSMSITPFPTSRPKALDYEKLGVPKAIFSASYRIFKKSGIM